MSLGQFSYLLQGAPRPGVTADRLDLLAKTAAKRYVDDGVALNESITKLADENGLNAEQVKRVCEMANIATHQALFPRAADKVKVAFPLANARAISAAATPASPKGQPTMADYAGPPVGIPRGVPTAALPASTGHNGLGPLPEKRQVVIVLEKKAAERQRQRDKLIVAKLAAETAEKQAFRAVKQAVLGGTSLFKIAAAARAVGLEEAVDELLPGFQKRLLDETYGELRERLVKTAIHKAPSELISENLGNLSVINGANPVIVSLDTVVKKNGIVKNELLGLHRIDDEIKVYEQRLRELS